MSCRLHQLGGRLTAGRDVKNKKESIRVLKREAARVLETSGDFHDLFELSGCSILKVINCLFALLYHKNPVVKWNAVTAMGSAVSSLAETDMDSARNIIRRLMWNLNDESGGIGWGSAEAMGDILAKNRNLAMEYSSVLLSYAREDGNFQEHQLMQRGVLWAIGRFCQACPDMLGHTAIEHIIPFLESNDAHVRGLAARVLGCLKAKEARSGLEKLKTDENIIRIYYKESFTDIRVKDLAQGALTRIGKEL